MKKTSIENLENMTEDEFVECMRGVYQESYAGKSNRQLTYVAITEKDDNVSMAIQNYMSTHNMIESIAAITDRLPEPVSKRLIEKLIIQQLNLNEDDIRSIASKSDSLEEFTKSIESLMDTTISKSNKYRLN